MWPNPLFPADLVTSNEEILNGKRDFFVQCLFHLSNDGRDECMYQTQCIYIHIYILYIYYIYIYISYIIYIYIYISYIIYIYIYIYMSKAVVIIMCDIFQSY